MTIDVKIFYFLNNLAGRSALFDNLIIFFAAYLQYFLIAVFFLLLLVWQYSKQEKIRIFLVTAISVIIARLGITEIIRFFYHRPRPFLTHQAHQLLSENQWSFPSGHSAFFFAFATAIYLYNKKWGVGFFLAAFLMNISRIVAGIHYPSDILGGMIIGIIVGYAVFYFANMRQDKKTYE